MDEEFPALGSTHPPSAPSTSTSTPSPPLTAATRRPKALNVAAAEFVPSAISYPTSSSYPDPNHQYNAALDAFDEMFPSLGAANGSTSPTNKANPNDINGGNNINSTVAAGEPSSSPKSISKPNGAAKINTANIANIGFVNQQRLLSLREKFAWVHPENVLQILKYHDYSLQPSEDYLAMNYLRPINYVGPTSADNRSRGNGNMNVSSTAKSGRTRETGTWVTTGKSVGALYEELRVQAGELARLRNGCFDRAKKAKLSGSQSEAARLAAEGHKWNDLMFQKHGEAADALFKERNPLQNVRKGIIDLHGLHVREALERLPDAIAATDKHHTRSVRILTGTGHHTKGTGKARLRPAVENWLRDNDYKFEIVEDKNSHVGAFLVSKK